MAYVHKWKTEKRPSECTNPIDYTKKYIVYVIVYVITYVIYVVMFVMAFIIKDVNEKNAKTRNDVTHQTIHTSFY